MKTPSSLLLLPLLSAALTASAEIPAGERCDKAFLERVVSAYRAGGVVSDPRIGVTARGGIDIPTLVFGKAETCDAATWRLLATGEQPAWRVEAVKAAWESGRADAQAAILLAASDFFKDVDAKAAAVLAKADLAVAAGVALGIAKQSDLSDSQAGWWRANAGGRFAAERPKLTVAEAGAATVTPLTVGDAYRKLVPPGSSGAGSAVLEFRLAVLALAAELGRQARTNAYVAGRLGAQPAAGLKDHLGGVPSGFSAGPADGASAANAAKYQAALQSLVGSGPAPAVDSGEARASAALDAVDLGLRNLIAIRAAEIEKLAADATAKLATTGKSVAEIEALGRAAETAGRERPNNALAADVMRRMTEAPEYLRLDALYDSKKDQPGWKDSPDGKAVIAARERLQAAALSAAVEPGEGGAKRVVYTSGGRKYTLDAFEPGKVETDAATREDAAGLIARMIVGAERRNPQFAALTAAIAGEGQPGAPLNTNLTLDESALAAQVRPPADAGAGKFEQSCESPKDLFRNNYERYAARMNSAAADLAESNITTREGLRQAKEAALTASRAECDRRKAEAAAIKQDFFEEAAISERARAEKLREAETWCSQDAARIEAEAAQKLKDLQAAEAGGDRDPRAVHSNGDAVLRRQFTEAILRSVDKLRQEYTTQGSGRLKSLIELTGNSPRLTAFTAQYFAEAWPTAEDKKATLEAAAASCATDLGLGSVSSSNRTYRNPEDPDNVDEYCKVGEKLTAFIRAQGGRAIRAAQ